MQHNALCLASQHSETKYTDRLVPSCQSFSGDVLYIL